MTKLTGSETDFSEPADHSQSQETLRADRSECLLLPQIDEYYDELLRTYVIMGSGNLRDEIAKLAEILSLAEMSPRQGLELHLERVEALVGGLGNRSARHVLARADLLALELMIHLGEHYRKKYAAVGR